MPFWTPRRGTSPTASDGSTAHQLSPQLEPIRLFLPDRQVEGWIISTDERITDLLNRRETFRVCVDPTSDVWESADLEELLLVAPPHHVTDPQRRVHRRKQRLVALVGPYVASGVAYRAFGAEVDPYLLRTRQHFLPMTDAHVTNRIDGTVDELMPVVIVNVINMTELRTVLSAV